MSHRSDRRAQARWEADTRQWATQQARALALSIYRGGSLPVRPYRLGIVLDEDESVWAECPAQFNFGVSLPPPSDRSVPPPYRPWLVTTERIVGRLEDDRLCGYRWTDVAGCRFDLTAHQGWLALDVEGQPLVTWTGVAVAPLVVAAAASLYGHMALLDHPGLTPLRQGHLASVWS